MRQTLVSEPVLHFVQPQEPPEAGVYFRRAAGLPEVRVTGWVAGSYGGRFAYALCQIDSRNGGYVEERDAEGRVLRRHPAGHARRAAPGVVRIAGKKPRKGESA